MGAAWGGGGGGGAGGGGGGAGLVRARPGPCPAQPPPPGMAGPSQYLVPYMPGYLDMYLTTYTR